jgi:hypothetical protein
MNLRKKLEIRFSESYGIAASYEQVIKARVLAYKFARIKE